MDMITLAVEPDVQKAFEQTNEEDRQVLGALIALFLTEPKIKTNLLAMVKKNEGKPRLMAQLRKFKISAPPDLSVNHDRYMS